MANPPASALTPPRRFLRMARRNLFRSKIADSSGMELTGGRLLTAALVLRRLLRRVLDDDERTVGLLLPPSVGAVIANAAVTLAGRAAVNLNYTLSDGEVDYCIRQAGIRRVLTSRRFLEKRPINFHAEAVHLEDFRGRAGRWDKLASLIAAYLLPAAVLERRLGLNRTGPDELLTVIFTSGSTGEPKGVMLSHRNVGSNLDGVEQRFHISRDDVVLGVLPFFHSFGYTANLWLALNLDPRVVYHFNPVDARTVGKLCREHGVTITMATPTFLRTWMKRCEPEQFTTLDTVVVGAEKMPLELAAAFKEKFGIEPTEGYGTTELSPVAAANVPEHRLTAGEGPGTKLGTVGRPFPGVEAKIVHPETGEDLGPGGEGLLFIKGPNVMQGYLNLPEKTAEVLRDGWYNTGDIARIDADGFIKITGRQSRFSKIGGEMVPHVRIEQELAKIVDESAGDDAEAEVQLAVTAVPDEKKGERLIVLHRPLSKPVEQLRSELADAGLPNLWIPAHESFIEVEEIPVLGTGKLDLKAVKQLALEKAAPVPAET